MKKILLTVVALAGLFTGDIRVAGIYRSQWASITVPFQTSAFSFEYKLPNLRNDNLITVGAQVAYDEAGDIKLKRIQMLPVINLAGAPICIPETIRIYLFPER